MPQYIPPHLHANPSPTFFLQDAQRFFFTFFGSFVENLCTLDYSLQWLLHAHIEVGERGGRRRHLLWLHCGALLLLLLLQEVLVAHAAEALRVDAAEESAAILAEAWVALLCV